MKFIVTVIPQEFGCAAHPCEVNLADYSVTTVVGRMVVYQGKIREDVLTWVEKHAVAKFSIAELLIAEIYARKIATETEDACRTAGISRTATLEYMLLFLQECV